MAFPLHPEQELNVGLGVRHGMALGIGPRHMTEARVAAAARRLTGDPSFRMAAKRVQALYAGIDGPACAAKAIVDYLATTHD
ncbi:MAG: hypothetical protein IPP90_05235 [Gemmatimonadaceae bacterium]|nr:hypothetical protein [Gemmatimonadaceae bacterium]